MEGANTLFDTVDVLFGTIDREGVGNEEGANLLLLPPLWSALLALLLACPAQVMAGQAELILLRSR